MFLIPGFYLLFLYVFKPFRKSLNFWGFYILNIILFFRYYVVSIFSIYYNMYFHTFILPSDKTSTHISIFIILYEMMFIFLIQNHFLKKLKKIEDLNVFRYFYPSNSNFLVFFSFLGFFFILVFENIRERLNFIQVSSFETSNLNTIFFTFFLISSVSFLLIFLAIIDTEVKNKIYKKKVNYFLIIISSFFAISFFFTTNRLTIVTTTLAIIYILTKYDLVKKIQVFFLVSICVLSVLSLSFYRWFEAGDLVESNQNAVEYLTLVQISNYLQAYFSGHHLISAAVQVDYDLSVQLKISSFFDELFNSVIYLRQLFPLSNINSTVVYNKMFGFLDGNSMILPTLGQSYMYFGLAFSPLLSSIFLFLLFFSEKMVLKSNTVPQQFSFVLLSVWWAFFPMQNLNIFVASFFFKFLPLYVLVSICSRKFNFSKF